MFSRTPNRAPAPDLQADIDGGFPAFGGLADMMLPADSVDDLPITTVMKALSGREPDAIARREEVELSIRTHWAALCRLVMEYEQLSKTVGLNPVPNVTRIAPRPVKARAMVPPAGRSRASV